MPRHCHHLLIYLIAWAIGLGGVSQIDDGKRQVYYCEIQSFLMFQFFNISGLIVRAEWLFPEFLLNEASSEIRFPGQERTGLGPPKPRRR